MGKIPINKEELIQFFKNIKDPNNQGKALGLTMGTGIAGGTIGALTGEVLGSPITGGLIGLGVGSSIGAYKSKKYFTEASDASPKRKSVPCKGIKKKLGFGCFEELKYGKGTSKFYISTHRARSKSYNSFDKIPESVIKFIDSTG
jgi:hypothetical protein